jgi:hypothetical protein
LVVTIDPNDPDVFELSPRIVAANVDDRNRRTTLPVRRAAQFASAYR